MLKKPWFSVYSLDIVLNYTQRGGVAQWTRASSCRLVIGQS